MKKNGKKYRTIQKKKEQNRLKQLNDSIKIEQEVDEINTALLSVSHIIMSNPIMKDTPEIKKEYLSRLYSYVCAGKWNRRKYVISELKAYERIILSAETNNGKHDMNYYMYYLLLDVIHIIGYEIKAQEKERHELLKQKMVNDYGNEINKKIFNTIINSFKGENRIKKLKELSSDQNLVKESKYINLILKNIKFMDLKPVGILVTATMSAGKSTFINSLTGKYVCLSQNMACTSKIHNIINKAYEDGYAYEYDHDLEMTAGREELLNDNELNISDKIIVGTHFIGGLSNHRMIISDSPGVNYSGNIEHKDITERLIKARNYHLMIYIMNATQLGTNDESEHLEYIKKIVGDIPVLFVINKIDAFNVEEEDLNAAIRRQKEFLEKKGFKKPMICPVSARAGYLSKKFEQGELSRTETREMYNYIDKFSQMKLSNYYEMQFRGIKIKDSDNEEKQLQKNCGASYVEKLITKLTGGK